MTVRAVVTASGRIGFGGTGYEPRGDVWWDSGGAIDGGAAGGADARAVCRRPSQQCRPSEARGALVRAGRSDGGRADRRGAEGRAGRRGARRAVRAVAEAAATHGRGVLVGTLAPARAQERDFNGDGRADILWRHS